MSKRKKIVFAETTPEREQMMEMYARTTKDIEEGSIVKGTIVEIRPQEVLVNIGFKSEGVLPATEFNEDLSGVQLGDEVEVLLELGIPIETRCRDGHSPLHLAASFKHFDAVRLLIDYGADPNAQDNEGDFCLLYLPQVRAPLMFYREFLAHPGIKVNLRNHAGESAMHYMASFNTDPKIWKAFVDAGADCNLRDNRGRTPLDVAEAKDSAAAAEFLRSIGAKHGAELPPIAAPPRRRAEPVKTEIPEEYWYMGGVAALMVLMLLLAVISFCRRRRG